MMLFKKSNKRRSHCGVISSIECVGYITNDGTVLLKKQVLPVTVVATCNDRCVKISAYSDKCCVKMSKKSMNSWKFKTLNKQIIKFLVMLF